MAITNHDRVGKAMELLKGGLAPSSSASSRASTRTEPRPNSSVSWARTV